MEALWQGLLLVITWPAIGYMLFGILVGLYLGAVPGLGGIIGLSLLMPFTFGMEPASAFAMLLGMYAVTTTSDTLGAVLLGVPGTAASAATVLDGYPLAQQGQAMRALSAAFTVSAVGGVIGAVVMALMIPFLRPLVLSFGPPEFFMLGVFGLTLVGALSGRSLGKGLLAAFVGLLLATVGYSTQGGIVRYHFGANYLLDGVPLVPLVLGLFAIPEIIDLATANSSIARYADRQTSRGQLLQGVRDAIVHRWLVLRSAFIGIYIGLLPGVGGSIADWVAYGHAVQSARDKSRFGHGDIRGVIASETANNAMKGGALLPTVAFGIPGAPAMAVLLGAFLIHGLRPGPELLSTRLDITFSLMWTLVIANVLGALVLMAWGRQLTRITFVRGNLVVPLIVLFVFMGAWMTGNRLGDWVTLLLAGAFGTLAKRGGWPRPPILLGFILEPIMEVNLDLSYQVMGWSWTARPIVMTMLAILALVLLHQARAAWRRKRRGETARAGESTAMPEPWTSAGMAIVATGLFAGALLIARGWPVDARFFPLIIGGGGTLLAMVVLGVEIAALRRPTVPREAGTARRSWPVYAMLCGLVAGSVLFGQLVALPAMIALYLVAWARERWSVALLQAAVGWLLLYFMFGRLLHVIWYPAPWAPG